MTHGYLHPDAGTDFLHRYLERSGATFDLVSSGVETGVNSVSTSLRSRLILDRRRDICDPIANQNTLQVQRLLTLGYRDPVLVDDIACKRRQVSSLPVVGSVR